MGGYTVRLYASLYRNEVAGMVLVDASHPDQENRFPPELKNMEGSWLREAEFLEYTMPFGIPRLMGLCDDDPAAARSRLQLSHGARRCGRAERLFRQRRSDGRYRLARRPASGGAFARSRQALGRAPADLAKSTNDAWEKMQEELSHLSTRGTQKIAKNSGHYIQIDRPDDVIEAVRNIVEQARVAQSPLPANSN